MLSKQKGREIGTDDKPGNFRTNVLHDRGSVKADRSRDVAGEAGYAYAHVTRIAKFDENDRKNSDESARQKRTTTGHEKPIHQKHPPRERTNRRPGRTD